MDTPKLYLQIAEHYRSAMQAGALPPGSRMPSVRTLMRVHQVSLSTALHACRNLEDDGWVQARPRAGYFVRPLAGARLPKANEPDPRRLPDPAHYVGIHKRVSHFVTSCERHPLTRDLASAYASADAYPVGLLNRATQRALRLDPSLLGTPPVAAKGHPALREVLARRALEAGMHLSPEDITITQGCVEALNISLRAVTWPGDVVAVESPTFYGLLQVLESLGLRALEIPTSPRTGMSLDALELALRTQPDIKAVVVVPNLQSPLSCVMPDLAKARLVDLCRAADVALIEDDSYSALHEGLAPLQAVKAWDRDDGVIHCASLRKIVAPGLRIGWVAGGRWHERIQMLKHTQSRANDALGQIAVAEVMGSPAYDRHLVRLRQRLGRQRRETAAAIASFFPPGTRLSVPDGSMLLWVELPQGISAQAVFERVLPLGIRFVPGSLFSNSSRFDHFLRISCGASFDQGTEDALRTIGEMAARCG